METQPRGKTRLQQFEKQVILDMRLRGFSIDQIADYTQRSRSSIKRVIYQW